MPSEFSGNPKTEWLEEPGDDRRMSLLEAFWYEDPAGRRWGAPVGSVVDGASIPAPLWSIVGSPYTGDYRRASIVHDVACADPLVDRAEADKMFYYACLAGGCSERQAQLLYAGVRIGAWTPAVRLWSEEAVHRPIVTKHGVNLTITESSIKTTFYEIASELESQPPDLPVESLQRIVDKHLSAKAMQ
jgi:hypothetical protein